MCWQIRKVAIATWIYLHIWIRMLKYLFIVSFTAAGIAGNNCEQIFCTTSALCGLIRLFSMNYICLDTTILVWGLPQLHEQHNPQLIVMLSYLVILYARLDRKKSKLYVFPLLQTKTFCDCNANTYTQRLSSEY